MFVMFRYKIEQLADQRLIILDLQFSVCFESDDCQPVVTICKSQLLPMPLCGMKMDFREDSKYMYALDKYNNYIKTVY